MKKKLILIFSTILLSFATSCNNDSDKAFEKQSFNLDTTINQKVYGNESEAAANEVVNTLADIENKMTAEGNASDVARINQSAGKGNYVSISPETAYVIEKAKYFYNTGEKTFDITIGPLVKLWGITKPNPHVPPKEKIDELLPLLGNNDIEVNPQDKKQYRLKRVGQSIDLGGIAKGYAGDACISVYKKHNITSAFINLGGNVCVLGKKPDGSLWHVGIQNPRSQNGRTIGILEVSDTAVVTSGDYQRYFEENGIRYHHMLDPKTGYPSNSGLISTTIVTKSSIDADGLSKTLISGLDKSFEFLSKFPEVGAIFITANKEVYITKNLEGKFKFNDESGEFKFIESR